MKRYQISHKLILMVATVGIILLLIGCTYAIYDFLTAADTIDGVPVGDLVYEEVSPDGALTVEFYRTSGGATTGFAMLGVMEEKETGERARIFWEYPCETVKVDWDDAHIYINDIKLKKMTEVYDFRYGIENREVDSSVSN
ncbi:hypothetical protein EVJ33_04845 [Exiguobacterium sp. SL-10]|uniref:DUF5412 family protein n=1 Tax=unclassified Exiguobacterium TaxID=2644629 RepID=UPI00103F805C|nr:MULTISPECIES: DUF5412 family protein [unclassified Exiguobacterium]TCI22958.1 hypothetical protein EVJ34_00650 [Exiguobacterium sp. SL-9]TCI30630.1 hypothetical protein EVJ33_04845 [Exiguobacterium sp. SL-10]